MKRALLFSLLVLAACNEPFSNEDILFLKALPTQRDVELGVPQALSSCPAPTASYYMMGSDVATGINGAVRDVLGLVSNAVRYPPTQREDDLRVWGPWTDDNVDFVFALNRVHTSTTVKTTSTSTRTEVSEYFDYQLRAKRHEESDFITVIAGRFFPTDDFLDSGMGGIFLNFEEYHQRIKPMDDKLRGLFFIGYDKRFGEQRIEAAIDVVVDLTKPFEKIEAGYAYTRTADGARRFDFIAETNIPEIQPDNNPEYLLVRQRYVADGRGRAEVGVKGTDLGTFVGYETECWDACFQRTFFASNVGKPGSGDFMDCAPELQTP